MRQGDGGNHQIVWPNRDAATFKLRPNPGIMLSGAVVEGKRLEWMEEAVEPGPRSLGRATLCYPEQQFRSHYRTQ